MKEYMCALVSFINQPIKLLFEDKPVLSEHKKKKKNIHVPVLIDPNRCITIVTLSDGL